MIAGMAMQGDERRRHERSECLAEVRIHDSQSESAGELRDISLGGARIVIGAKSYPVPPVWLAVRRPGGGDDMLPIEIVRRQPGSEGDILGVRFASDANAAVIESLVARLR